MKYNVLILAFLISSFGTLIGQNGNFWKETSETLIPTKKSTKDYQQPLEPKYFELDFKDLKRALKDAPMEYTSSSKELILSFPLADGSVERFEIFESPVMAPKLAAKYPNIKTYRGLGVDNPLHSIHFDYTLNGFHGSIYTPDGMIYIDPFTEGSGDFCMVYNTSKLTAPNESLIPPLDCGVTADLLVEQDTKEEFTEKAQTQLRSAQIPVTLKVYKFALACTGEYALQKGGTLESVNASYATAINRVNQIFQSEVAVKLELIEENDRLIFLDPNTDPYENPRTGLGLLGQNRPAFVTAGVFDDTYDIGQVFTIGCTDVGGVVSGRMCAEGKMRGVTCHASNNIEFIVINIMAHEVGHQFSCAHSWDNCPNSADQRAGGAAFEPGSGTTIMSYEGTCGDQNLPNSGNNTYYNIGSLQSFIRYSREVVPNCGTEIPLSNNYPTVEVPYQDGFYIPSGTPFELTAIGNDEDGDAITYCWEQRNNEVTASTIGNPMGNAPIIRSRPPTSDPTRLFPTRANVLANISSISELLPTYDRDLTFVCTVRDNVPEGGGTVWDAVDFKVDGESGPFRLSFPSSLNDALTAGEYVEFTWDPANSQNAPVNCKAVNLLLSYDNGTTFTDTLATNVINDGSYFVNIPETVSNVARVKIEAADNIFFDFSNNRIQIAEATVPSYTLNIPEFQEVCAPDNVSFDIITSSVLDFDNPVELSLVGDIPTLISNASFVNNSLIPGERSTLELAIDQPEADITIELMVQAVSQDADTIFKNIRLDLLTSDFSSISLNSPADGVSGIAGAPEFVWDSNANASSFEFQLATSPSFNEESIFVSVENLTETSYTLNNILDVTTLYYWRVIPTGTCGRGEPTIPAAFQTEATSCQVVEAPDLPINISASFSGDLESKINVTQGGLINDINVIDITGSHQDFADLSLTLESPSGTSVKLVSNKCFAQNTSFDMAFDQESPFSFACPPNNVFVPEESLDAFNGENAQGVWELIINDRAAQSGGSLQTWSLEFCSNIASDPPNLVRNNSLQISEDFEKVIKNDLLRVEDANNADFELFYTVVKSPIFGELLLNNVPLFAGDQFTQNDLNNFLISYKSDANIGDADNFLFTVIDGEGGFTGTHSFGIDFVDANVSTDDLKTINVEVFPNPVSDLLYVKTNNNFALLGNMEVYNLQGQLMIQQGIKGNVRETINTSPLGNGIYFLKIQDGEKYSISKFVVER